MAKKRVKYAFSNPDKYASILKKDEYTVYFVYNTTIDANGKEVPGQYGTIYKGNTRVGSAIASDIVFDKKLVVTVLQGSTEEDSVYYTIEPGTSLTQFVEGLIQQTAAWDEKLYSDFVGDGTPANPGIIYATIEQETTTEGGVISDEINSRIADSIDKDGVISSYLEANYVSNDSLGRIEELAKILDAETLDKLINAAAGIEKVLGNYYTKEEADALLQDVITADTSAGFPEVGDSKKLYVSADDNYMYRWGKYDPTEETEYYVMVSGGGGGGSANVKIETHVYIKNSATSVSIAKDTDFTAYYAFSSANTYTTYHPIKGFQVIQQQIGNIGSVKYYLDGVQIGSGQCVQANYYQEDDEKNKYNTYTIPRAKFTGTRHTLKIVASDVNGNTAEESITINIVNVVITSSFAGNPSTLEKDLTIPVTVASSGSVDVFYQVDDDAPVLGLTIKSGSGTNNLIIPNVDEHGSRRTHGTHIIKVWAKTYIKESCTEIITSPIEWEVIWYDPMNPLPIVSFVCTDEKQPDGTYAAVQYEYASFVYQVYPSSDIQLVSLKDGVETVIKDLVDMDTTAHKWSYIFDEPGTYTLYAKIKYNNNGEEAFLTSEQFTINVYPSTYTMEPVAGAMLYMSAKNHDNNSSHEWISEIHTNNKGEVLDPIKAILTNFAWNNNSGWYVDGATTSLRVGGGARCEIPFKPFYNNFSNSGMTFEIDFATSNLSNSETEVIKCYSEQNKKGITITATGAYWETGDWSKTDTTDTRIHVPFKEEERIRLSFVLTPYAADDAGNGSRDASIWNESSKSYDIVDTVKAGWWKFLKVYINGICVSIDSYTDDGRITQTGEYSTILIGSDEATVDLYSVRMYPKVLYDKEIVDNYIADTQDPVEKLAIFKRNNVLNDAGTAIDNIKLSTMLPCLYVTCQSTASNANSGCLNAANILPMNKKDKRGYIAVYNCDNLTDEYKANFPWAKSFIAYNAQMTVQGTSSQYYPRKNYKLTFRTDAKKGPATEEEYRKVVESKKPTLLYIGTTGTGYDDTTLDNWVMNSVLTDDMKSKYSKKYKLRDFAPEVEKTDIEHISSISATKYCLKADFMESSSTHNTGVAKYADFLLKGIGEEYLTPPQLGQFKMSEKIGTARMNDVDIRTTVDGYPCAVFWRQTVKDKYTFLGKYNFNHDKGAESVFGFIDLPDGLINPYTGYTFAEFDEKYVDDAAPADRALYESPVECWEFTNNTTNLCKFKNVTETSFTETTKNEDGDIVPAWIESFEARHPDNDTLIGDMEDGVWVPNHWANFLAWVSSTDTYGYHDPATKLLQVPYKWEGTVDELLAGAADSESYITIKGTLEELNEGIDGKFADCIQSDGKGGYIKGILEPEVLVDNEMIPNSTYIYYGYIVTYDESEKVWKLGEKYVPKDTKVDIKKAYYIAKSDDINFNKVYQYVNNEWKHVHMLSEYMLPAKVTYDSVDYLYDTAEYRLKKFYFELKDHMRVKFTIAYYVLSEFFNCIDQRAKNMMFATWGYEPEDIKEVRGPEAFTSVEAAAKAGYKPVYKYKLVDVPEEGFILNRGYIVKDEQSYGLLPESYRSTYGEWGTPGLEESLPWLAVEFDATPAKDLAIKVEGPGEFVKEISYPEVEKEVTLLTLNADELGTEIVDGIWKVTVNGYTIELEKTSEPSDVIEGVRKTKRVTTKTPLYYVPNKYNYKYYPIFYDNDSVLGLNNTGYLMYGPNTESTDTVGSGYAFNGADSVLWVNLATEFNKEIAEVYALLRKNGLTYDKAIYYFNDSQSSAWSESVYNMDAKFKYVEPATIGYIDFSKKDNDGKAGVNVHDSYYLFECQGSRATHRSWWLSNRLNYMDSRYDTGEYHDSYALFRIYTNLAEGTYNKVVEPDPTFYITPYTDMYLRIKFGSRYGVVRANKNVTYMVNSGTDDKYNDTETMVYGAANILSYGDLTAKYVKLCNVGPSSRITDLILGHDAPYFNDNLTNLSFNPSNTALKKVDVRNCRQLNTLVNLNSLTSIEEFLATNTSLASIDFSTKGVNIKKIEYPASLGSMKLVNMPYISNSGITFESYNNLRSVWIEKCPNMNSWQIINNILSTTNNVLGNVRLTDVNWNIQTNTAFAVWTKLLGLGGMDEYGASNSYTVPYITGKVNLSKSIVISTGYKEGVAKLIKENTNGAKLEITGGSETGLSGIKISGPETITPGVQYKYVISYSPDNYVLDSEKGVTWTLPEGLEIHEQTNDYIILSFEGSASGTESFKISATSRINPEYTNNIVIRPGATLEHIKLYTSEGLEFTSEGLTIYEGDTASINVRFTPEDTKDSDIVISITNEENFVEYGDKRYEYDNDTKTITLTGADVSSVRTSVLTVTSATVPSVSVSIPIYVKNIVSRLVHLRNETRGLHEKLEGYVDVTVEGDPKTYRVFSNGNGTVMIPTNEYDPEHGKFGLKKITVQAHAEGEGQKEFFISRPAPITFAELPEGVAVDIEATAEFYEPISCEITVKNSGNNVDDAWLMISSLENQSTYATMNTPPYNNVCIKPTENPVTIKLLANTTHTISIVQVEEESTIPVTTKLYSDFQGTIKTGTGTAVQKIEINVARDYLGDITDQVDATELRMRIATADEGSSYTTYKYVRLYYIITGPVTVHWGDGRTDTITDSTVSYGKEGVIYHDYESIGREYTISIKEDTTNVKWFHVISSSSNNMGPCIGTGNTDEGFPNESGWNAAQGGLVAYQSCGNAEFIKPLSFSFSSDQAKQKSRLLCVGNIYKNLRDMTSAAGLFKNSTLEQIPAKPMFANNTKITTFESCFENTNITTLPANFFTTNVNAVEFKKLCYKCTNLTSINTEENIQFLFPAENVEVKGLDSMFEGCTALVSAVPALWSEFYGCSFLENHTTNTFKDCPYINNINNVPESWGGNGPEYSYAANTLPLKYIEMPAGEGKYGMFEISHVQLKGNYKFVLDITVTGTGGWYGLVNYFGSGRVDDNNISNENGETGAPDEILSTLDFSWGGNGTSTTPTTSYGYLNFRNGNEDLITNFDNPTYITYPGALQTNQKDRFELKSPDSDGVTWSTGDRITFDICKTKEGFLTISKPNPNVPGATYKKEAYLGHLWTAESDYITNLPLRIFTSYANKVAYNGGNITEWCGNKVANDAGGKFKFHSLKIYDHSGNLVYDIVPEYAVIGGVPQAVLKDTLTPDRVYSVQRLGQDKMSYYRV